MKRLPVLVACAALVAWSVAQAQGADELLKKYTCTTCHAIDKKVVGPAYGDVAAKYRGDAKAPAMLMDSVKNGSVSKWGLVPMPAPSAPIPDADLKTMVSHILGLKK